MYRVTHYIVKGDTVGNENELVRLSNRSCGVGLAILGLALVFIFDGLGVGNIQNTHCQLFVLQCTTTWRKPGLSFEVLLTKFKNRLVFIMLLPKKHYQNFDKYFVKIYQYTVHL